MCNSVLLAQKVHIAHIFRNRITPFLGNPVFRIRCLLFCYVGGMTGSSLQILDVDFCGRGDTGSGKPKQTVDGTSSWGPAQLADSEAT